MFYNESMFFIRKQSNFFGIKICVLNKPNFCNNLLALLKSFFDAENDDDDVSSDDNIFKIQKDFQNMEILNF